MKKTVALILSLMMLFSLSACGPRDGMSKLTPEEEYGRVYNLSGKGATFDMNSVTSFEVSQKVNLSSEFIQSVQGGPTEETAVMQFSAASKDKGAAYSRVKSLNYISPEVSYHEFKEGYGNFEYDGETRYQYLWYSDANGTAVSTPYTSYFEMINLGSGNTLYSMRNASVLFDPAKLESFEGAPAPNGTYTVSAAVKPEAVADFVDFFIKVYPAFTYQDTVAGDNGTYLAWRFFDPTADYPMSADISVLSTKTSVRSVILNIKLMGINPSGELTISARSDYKIGGVTVKDVTKE